MSKWIGMGLALLLALVALIPSVSVLGDGAATPTDLQPAEPEEETVPTEQEEETPPAGPEEETPPAEPDEPDGETPPVEPDEETPPTEPDKETPPAEPDEPDGESPTPGPDATPTPGPDATPTPAPEESPSPAPSHSVEPASQVTPYAITEEEEDGTHGSGKGGFGGGGFGGGRSGAGAGAQTGGITAGEALTKTHAEGSGIVILYGALTLETTGKQMQVLTLGGEELPLDCGGVSFHAEIAEDSITLTAEEAGCWSLNQALLKRLSLSGIRELVLADPEGETQLDTGLEFSGNAFARERAQGYVSSDFVLSLIAGEWQVQVEDRTYRLDGTELKKTERGA